MVVATRTLTMAQAIAEAIGQEMERDQRVFVLGEDVGIYGGIFGATSGLLQRFGPERIMDTPISETAFIGAATGAAAAGMRPIVADVRRFLRRLYGPDLQPPGQEHVHVRWERASTSGAHHSHRWWIQ